MNLNLLIVAMLAAAPISECRGAIPFGLTLGYPPALVFLIAYLFNVFAGFLFLYLLNLVGLRKLIIKVFGKSLERKLNFAKRYESIGEILLIVFVAIPLPLTGAYTGAFIAHTLGFNKMKSFTSIAIGVLIACIIVTLATLGILNLVE